jgi:hypothetical protein
LATMVRQCGEYSCELVLKVGKVMFAEDLYWLDLRIRR